METNQINRKHSSADISFAHVDPKTQSQIIKALVSVIGNYLDTVSKNLAKLAEQDAQIRKEVEEAKLKEEKLEKSAQKTSEKEEILQITQTDANGETRTSPSSAIHSFSLGV